jgi:hypothetical protein
MTSRRDAWLRAGLWFLTLTQVGAGTWQLLQPRSFYEHAPLPGHPWVALLPPYNEHLMRDVGALNLGLGAVLAAAAITMDRRLARVSLLAYLIFAVPHLVFHTTHLQHFPTGDATAQTTVLAAAVLLPLALLLSTLPTPANRRRSASWTSPADSASRLQERDG